MIKEIALSETKPSVSSCHILLDSLQKICLMHGIEVDYYKKLFQTAGNIIELIEKDDIPKYLLFLENVFPYMDNYNYQKGMKEIFQELKNFLKPKDIGTDSDRALLLDFQATLEIKPEKAIKLEKDALAQIENITADNARLVSNLHANLGGLYRMNGHPDLAREHMEKSISLLDQFNLLHINDSIPQIANYAMFLTEQQEPERGISELQKLSGIIKGEWKEDEPILVRVHSSCATGDILGSKRCDCGQQLHKAMQMIDEAGKGVVVYMQQEGRGIGLMNKIAAYKLQEEGYDTVDANTHLGFKPDERDYGCGAQMLRHLGVHKMRLLTNNPVKRVGLEAYGLEIVENVPIEVVPNKYNERYLKTKRDRMGHTLHLG
jgi:GTP cyclohydrolase II